MPHNTHSMLNMQSVHLIGVEYDRPHAHQGGLMRPGISSAFVLLAITALPAIGEPKQGAQPGTTPAGPASVHVQQHSFVLHDAKRDKDLPVRVVYPEQFAADGPAPTIIFSHGAYGSGDMYSPLAFEWAMHGYIVILPTHSDSLAIEGNEKIREFFEGTLERKRRQRRGEVRKGDMDFADWPNRPRDISFVIDSLDEVEKQVPEIASRIDHDRIGVGGHSFGAFTTQLIGGTDPLGPGVFADPRAICQLLISPQGIGGLLAESSWKGFTGPALTISGDNDEGRNGEPAIWRRDGFDHSPPDSQTLLWIEGAYHNFGGISGRVLPGPDHGPANPHHVELVQRATLAFWDHHLRDQSDDTDAFGAALLAEFEGEAASVENN